MKTIGDVLIECKVVGRVIVLPDFGFDDNLFKAIKMVMYQHGGRYYASVKNKGFVFRDFDAQTTETSELLSKLIKDYNEIPSKLKIKTNI
jgi:hypothetical protein